MRLAHSYCLASRFIDFLIRDLVLIVLQHVIGFAAPVEVAVADDLQHVVGRLAIGGRRREARPELLNGAAAETWQSCVQHEGHQRHNGFPVRPGHAQNRIKNSQIGAKICALSYKTKLNIGQPCRFFAMG